MAKIVKILRKYNFDDTCIDIRYWIFQWWIVGTLASLSGGCWYAVQSVNASDLKAMPPHLPWTHKSHLKGFDHARSVYISCVTVQKMSLQRTRETCIIQENPFNKT